MNQTRRKINFRKLFASNIRELRILAGLSQEVLSERIGISPKTLSYWENGHNAVTFAKIPLLAKALGVPIYRLFIFDKYENSSAISDLLNTMNEHEKNVALGVLKLLLSLKQIENTKLK